MVVTVTLNPALDLTYSLDSPLGLELNRASAVTVEPSGKGINVALSLRNSGRANVRAILPVAGPNGHRIADELSAAGLSHTSVAVVGIGTNDTRINTTLIGPGFTTKINGPGVPLGGADIDALVDATRDALNAERSQRNARPVWLAICGSLPPGTPAGVIEQFIEMARSVGAKTVVDADGEVLRAAVSARATVIAPNRAEVSDVIADADDLDDFAANCSDFARDSGVRLLVSLGPSGALWADGTAVVHAAPPVLDPVNTAGSGDALLAGWLASVTESESFDPVHALSLGVLWGSRTCLVATTVHPNLARGVSLPIRTAILSKQGKAVHL